MKQSAKRQRHVPQRTCIACRQTLAKRSLIRLVRTAEGVKLDTSGKLAGRGAYLHDSTVCWNLAITRGVLAKSLKTELTTDDLDNLRRWMETLPDNSAPGA